MSNIFDNTWTPGFLEAIEDRSTIDYLKDVRTQLRETMLANYEPNKLKQQTEFNAICLRQMRSSTINGKNVVRVKARIPEIHTMIPIPKNATDYRTMALYPTFIGLKTDFSPNINPGSITPGTRLTVSFDQMANFAGPILKKVFDIGAGTHEAPESLKLANRSPLDWVQISTDGLEKIPSPARGGHPTRPSPAVSTAAYNKAIADHSVRLALHRASKRRWGVQKMQDYLDGLRHIAGGEHVNVVNVNTSLINGWYVQDISKITGGWFGPWDSRAMGSMEPNNFIPGGHVSHQSGIDADIAIPLVKEAAGPTPPMRAEEYHATIAPQGLNTSPHSWRFMPKSLAQTKVDELDIVAILAFLRYSAPLVKLIMLEPEFIARIYEGHQGQPGARDYASTGTNGWNQDLLEKLFGVPQTTQPSRQGAARAKLRDGTFLRRTGHILIPDFGAAGTGHGHSNHFHVRLNGSGALPDTNGNGKLLAPATDPAAPDAICKLKDGRLQYIYVDGNGNTIVNDCNEKGFHTETVTR